MKNSLTILTSLVVVLGASSVFAQTNALANRVRACNVNPGYSMADVVETARNFAWSEETAPGVVIFREAIAATNNPMLTFLRGVSVKTRSIAG